MIANKYKNRALWITSYALIMAPSESLYANGNHVNEITKSIAQQLALNYDGIDIAIRGKIHTQNHVISLNDLSNSLKKLGQIALSQQIESAHAQLKSKKINSQESSTLSLRLAHPAMLDSWKTGGEYLVSYIPSGSDHRWDSIEAFDRYGKIYRLDPKEMPNQPVLVVDTKKQPSLKTSVEDMNQALKDSGIHLKSNEPKLQDPTLSVENDTYTKLDGIEVQNTMEPWIKGSAEIYAIVAGVHLTENRPALEVVEMPYLDYSHQIYKPNQILISWEQYRFNAVNILLFEKDDDYDYKELADKLAQDATSTLNKLGEPEIGCLTSMGKAIIDAMPSQWYKDEDDFVDAFYNIEQNQYYLDHTGAGNNASMSLSPHQTVE